MKSLNILEFVRQIAEQMSQEQRARWEALNDHQVERWPDELIEATEDHPDEVLASLLEVLGKES